MQTASESPGREMAASKKLIKFAKAGLGRVKANGQRNKVKVNGYVGLDANFFNHRIGGGGVGIHRHRRSGSGNCEDPFRHIPDFISCLAGRAAGGQMNLQLF
jgi:hypothetical protein